VPVKTVLLEPLRSDLLEPCPPIAQPGVAKTKVVELAFERAKSARSVDRIE
jgi:hypothetical protein